MTHSNLTNAIRLSPQCSSREGVRIDTLLVHHTASVSGRGDGVVNMMVNRTRQVSANYVIGNDGYLWMVVDENLRAWTSGSTKDGGKGAAWDRRSITVEIVNQKGAPNWEISSAAIDKAARLLIDLRRRYRITNVLGHRDLWTKYKASYATYCPGPNTVAAILRREQEILRGGGGGAAPASPWLDVRSVQSRLNVWLAHWGVTPLLVVDGDYGPKTSAAARLAQQKFGITVDGEVGPQTWGKISVDPVVAPTPTPPAAPRIAWESIDPVKMWTWEEAYVVDPLTKVVKGTVAEGTALDIASAVTIDGVTYYRTDWSTRQGNDSGIDSAGLHRAPRSIPEPGPEPEPDPSPTEPEPDPSPTDPPFPEPVEPDLPPQHAKPSSNRGLLYVVIAAVVAAVAAIFSLF